MDEVLSEDLNINPTNDLLKSALDSKSFSVDLLSTPISNQSQDIDRNKYVTSAIVKEGASVLDEVPLDDEENDIFSSAISMNENLNDTIPFLNTTNQQNSILSSSKFFSPTANPSAIMNQEIEIEHTPGLQKMQPPQYKEILNINVTDPKKIGEGMASYIVYKVTTNTNLPFFSQKNSTVLRRFSDFLGLHEKLIEKFLHVGHIIPPPPEKNVIGTTKLKIGNSDPSTSSDFLDRRCNSLERYLRRNAEHPVIKADPIFHEFLETEGELPRASNTSALSGASVMKLLSRVGETVNKITSHLEETDPWFEEKSLQLDSLESQLNKLHASIEALATYRKELASATSAFATSMAMLSSCEEHSSLSRALTKLAEAEEKMETIYSDQSKKDIFLLAEILKDYIGLVGAVKDAFHERTKTYQILQHAKQTFVKKREAKAKLELAGRNEKLQQAKEEVEEWEFKVERSQEAFDSISKMIKEEVEHFDKNRLQDMQNAMIRYIESLIESQQEIINTWGNFMPHAQAIA